MAGAGGHGASGTNAVNASSSSSSNASSSLLFPRGPNSVSSLVRLALSSNFPGGLLSTAQSYPSLSNTLSSLSSVATHAVSMAGASSTNLHHAHGGASQGHQQTSSSSSHGLSQALSMSLTGSSDSEQVSLEDFLESCRAGTLLAELEDDDELPEPDEDDNEDDDENEDDEDFEEVTEEDGGGGVSSLVGWQHETTKLGRRIRSQETIFRFDSGF